MHRTLISSPHVGSYSALLVLALIGAWALARWQAKRSGIAPRHIDNLALLVAVTSLFGARLFSWLFYFPPGFSFWNAMTMVGGGLVFYGGLIFGIACVMIYGLVVRLPLLELLAVLSAPLALGLAIGRVGCFMAGCCWGDLCASPAQIHLPDARIQSQIQTLPILSGARFPLAVTFPSRTGAYEQHQQLGLIDQRASRSLPVHPVQLYEAMLALLLAFILHRQFVSKGSAAEICAKLIIGYAMIRFGTEFFRADNQPAYFGMTLSQVISALLATICVLLLRSSANPAVAMAKQPPAPQA